MKKRQSVKLEGRRRRRFSRVGEKERINLMCGARLWESGVLNFRGEGRPLAGKKKV